MLQKYSLYLIWIMACIATLGSLYFSELRHLEPCHLCWYQRITIYPLAIIMGIATYHGFYGIAPYVFPQAILGTFFAAYQVMIQEIPSWQPLELCGAGPSCSDKVYIGLGPITIPILSLLAFIAILLFLTLAWKECKALNVSKESLTYAK
jgi:disulfide bond formation protein DsbB